jgi:hypothetical protein
MGTKAAIPLMHPPMDLLSKDFLGCCWNRCATMGLTSPSTALWHFPEGAEKMSSHTGTGLGCMQHG